MERVWVEWNGAVHTRLHSTIVCLVRPTCTCRSDITTGWLLPNCNSEHAIRTRIRHDENNRAWVQQKQVGSVRCCARYHIAVRQLSDDPVKLSLGSALRTTVPQRECVTSGQLPHEMCFLYTCEEDVCSQDNFPTRCVFSIPVRKLSTLRTTSP